MTAPDNLAGADRTWRGSALIILIWAMAAGAAIAVPWWQHFVAPWRVEIVRVGERTVEMAAMVNRLRPVLTNLQPGTDPLSAAVAIVQSQRDELLVLEEATRRGILPSSADVDAEIRARVGTTNAGEDDAEARLGALVRRLGVEASDYAATVRSDLARLRLVQSLTGDAAAPVPHVLLAAVLLDNRRDAEQVAMAAKNQGNLADLAAQADLAVAEMDWTPAGVDTSLVRIADKAVLLIDDIALRMADGEVSPPLEAEEGYLVIQILGKASRAPSAEDRKTLMDRALSEWLTAEIKRRAEIGDVTWRWTSDHHRFASQQIKGTQ
ncbi:MAG: hypothetical protein AAF439_00095 [Pseudomonadota bacterium]